MLRVCLWSSVTKGWANELLIVGACGVHAMRENRFEALARNISPVMRTSNYIHLVTCFFIQEVPYIV